MPLKSKSKICKSNQKYVNRAQVGEISGDEIKEGVTYRIVMLNLKIRGPRGAGEALFGRIVSSQWKLPCGLPSVI